MSNIAEINIDHPELWNLELHITASKIKYLLTAESIDNSLTTGEIDIDTKAESRLKAIEAAIYDHQLLGDFREVRIVVDSSHFVLLPPEFSADDTAGTDGLSSVQTALEAAFGSIEGDMGFCQLKRCNAAIAYEMPKGLTAFLERTYFQPRIVHRLYTLCEHYSRTNADSEVARMHINFDADGTGMDMVVFNKGRLMLANSFCFASTADAVFYVLHAWESLKLDAKADEIQITGNRTVRDEVMPKLREYVNFVMPAIFPAAALKMGSDAVKAPLELILLALCE